MITALLLIGGGIAVAPASAATADDTSPPVTDVPAGDTPALPETESVEVAPPETRHDTGDDDRVTEPPTDTPEPTAAPFQVDQAPAAPVAPVTDVPVAEAPVADAPAAPAAALAADPAQPTMSIAYSDDRLLPGEHTSMTLTFTNTADLAERYFQVHNGLPRPAGLLYTGGMSWTCHERNWTPPFAVYYNLDIVNLGFSQGMTSCSFTADMVATRSTGTFANETFNLWGLTLTDAPSVYVESFTVEQSADVAEITTPGQVITYSTTVTNVSDVTKKAVAPLQTDFTGEGEPGPSSPVSADLAPRQSQTFTSTYTVTAADIAAGGVRRAVNAIAAPDAAELQGTASEVMVKAVPAPALSAQASTDRTTVSAAGDHVVYTVVLTNTGNVRLSNVSPFDTAFSGTGEGYPISGAPADLDPGQSVTFVGGYVVSDADIASGAITATFAGQGTDPAGERTVADGTTVDVTVASIPVIPATPVTPDVPAGFVPDATPTPAAPAPAAAPAQRSALAETGVADLSGGVLAAMLFVAAGAVLTIRRRRHRV